MNRKINIGDKVINLKIESLGDELNIDDMLNIDYANIMGEILTFPVLVNRLGLLLADIEAALEDKTLDVSLAKNDLAAKKGLHEMTAFSELKKGGKDRAPINSPTKPQIEAFVLNMDLYKKDVEKYTKKQRELIQVQKDRNYINSIYWAAKSKDDKLDKMTTKLSPSEFEGEILDGTINGVMIKSTQALFSNKT